MNAQEKKLFEIFKMGREKAYEIVSYLENIKDDERLPDKDKLSYKINKLLELLIDQIKDIEKKEYYFAASYISPLFNERIAFYDTLDSSKKKYQKGRCNLADLNKSYAQYQGPGISNLLISSDDYYKPWFEVSINNYAKNEIEFRENQLKVNFKKLNKIFDDINTEKKLYFPKKNKSNDYGISRSIVKILNKIMEYKINYDEVTFDCINKWLGDGKKIFDDETDKRHLVNATLRPLHWFYLVVKEQLEINHIYFINIKYKENHSGLVFVFGLNKKNKKEDKYYLAERIWYLKSLCLDTFLPIIDGEINYQKKFPDLKEKIENQISTKWVFENPSCSATLDFKNEIEQYSKTDLSILLTGGRGTGKSTVAKFVHENSSRKKGDFVDVNCATLTIASFNEEMFGILKEREGFFSKANNGTLFLDEIGTICPKEELQNNLLTVLQEKAFYPVKSSQKIRTNFRLVTATWESIEKMREDLKDRIRGCKIEVPSLKTRFEECKLIKGKNNINSADENYRLSLITIFKFNKKINWLVWSIEEQAIQEITQQEWKGNIREFENFIYRVMVKAKKDHKEQIKMEHMKEVEFIII